MSWTIPAFYIVLILLYIWAWWMDTHSPPPL